jgi:hypothetical protein
MVDDRHHFCLIEPISWHYLHEYILLVVTDAAKVSSKFVEFYVSLTLRRLSTCSAPIFLYDRGVGDALEGIDVPEDVSADFAVSGLGNRNVISVEEDLAVTVGNGAAVVGGAGNEQGSCRKRCRKQMDVSSHWFSVISSLLI